MYLSISQFMMIWVFIFDNYYSTRINNSFYEAPENTKKSIGNLIRLYFESSNQYKDVMNISECYGINDIVLSRSDSDVAMFSVVINYIFDETNANNNVNCFKLINHKNTLDIIDNKKAMLSIYQIIGIILCGLLLGIFFFIAGYLRIKNCLRRNSTNVKLSNIRSWLTTEDVTSDNQWRNSLSNNSPDDSQPHLRNYLQMQSNVDKSISNFMMKQSLYIPPQIAEHKPTTVNNNNNNNTTTTNNNNSSFKRKNSVKRKLSSLKRFNSTNQNLNRRNSLTSEIDSVMNKHFSMLGLTRKPTNNPSTMLPQQSQQQLSQNIQLNSFNHPTNNSKLHRSATTHLQPSMFTAAHSLQFDDEHILRAGHPHSSLSLMGAASTSGKKLPFRHQRLSTRRRPTNFPGRRATTIGSCHSNHVYTTRAAVSQLPPTQMTNAPTWDFTTKSHDMNESQVESQQDEVVALDPLKFDIMSHLPDNTPDIDDSLDGEAEANHEQSFNKSSSTSPQSTTQSFCNRSS